MNFLKSIWTRLTTPVAQRSGSDFARAWLAGEVTLRSHATLGNPFSQSTWVYACITALAENVSAIPFRILTGPESNERVLQNHPALDLFNNPHPNMDRFQFWELLVTWLCLRGEAFILPSLSSLPSVGNSARLSTLNPQPSTLMLLSPDHMQEVVQDHQLVGWRYNAPRYNAPVAAAAFFPEEVIHIKLPNPFNFWRGMSPLTVAWLAAQTDYSSSQFMKGMMANNADTGLIVTSTEQLTEEQREQFTAALRDRKRGSGMADDTIFLSGGVKVEKPTISAVDLQFLENRKFNRQEICAIYKVPQEVIGFTEDANRSVSESARLNFMENRIGPLCRRLEAGILPILQRFNNVGGARYSESYSSTVRGEFHIKDTPIMQAAQRARVDTAAKLFSMGVPMNTVNRVLDLGLPALPHGDTAWLPSKMQQVGRLEREDLEEAAGELDPEPANNNAAGLIGSVERCLGLLSPSPNHNRNLNRSGPPPSPAQNN